MIDDVALAARFRSRLLNAVDGRVLIANLSGSRESTDKYSLLNCGGYGRVREFRDYRLYLERSVFPDRPLRPNLRGYPPSGLVRTQVFQIAACNWRCWYCFVDDSRLSATRSVSKYFSAAELWDLFLSESNHPDILDLSGGQPDLVPEWTLGIVDECESRGLRDQIYIWLDDNLSNDYLFTYLREEDVRRLARFPRLSRMGCFKGFDPESFEFTTRAPAIGYERQFAIARKIIDFGFDFYAYATFTTPYLIDVESKIKQFIDKLQIVHELLPLRTVPLRIHSFAATKSRMNAVRQESLDHQLLVFRAWDAELRSRYPVELLTKRPDEIHCFR
jgi:uncharacterized Fe-S cluster-containing radical SAM superfamily protein